MREAVDHIRNPKVASVGMWSKRQYLGYLRDALSHLEGDESPLPFELDGRMAHLSNGKTVRLSPQEAQFLTMLIEAEGRPVTCIEFGNKGISNPANVKVNLLKKFNAQDIRISIASSPNAYQLPNR